MMDPRTQYIVYQERENALMRQIEHKLAAQERGRTAASTPWYLKTGQWLQEKVETFRPVKRQRIAEENCG